MVAGIERRRVLRRIDVDLRNVLRSGKVDLHPIGEHVARHIVSVATGDL